MELGRYTWDLKQEQTWFSIGKKQAELTYIRCRYRKQIDVWSNNSVHKIEGTQFARASAIPHFCHPFSMIASWDFLHVLITINQPKWGKLTNNLNASLNDAITAMTAKNYLSAKQNPRNIFVPHGIIIPLPRVKFWTLEWWISKIRGKTPTAGESGTNYLPLSRLFDTTNILFIRQFYLPRKMFKYLPLSKSRNLQEKQTTTDLVYILIFNVL